MSTDINVNVLVDAKKEYTKQLISFLSLPIYEGIKSIYDEAVEICNENEDPNYLRAFQLLLKQIPKWNQDMIDDEYSRIIEESHCDWIDNLLKAIFISHAKILSSIRLGPSYKKVHLNIPKGRKFIHAAYIECAHNFYKNPQLFLHTGTNIEMHSNSSRATDSIARSIEETIRKLVPVREILEEYLNEELEEKVDEKSEENDKTDSVSEKPLAEAEKPLTEEPSEDPVEVIEADLTNTDLQGPDPELDEGDSEDTEDVDEEEVVAPGRTVSLDELGHPSNKVPDPDDIEKHEMEKKREQILEYQAENQHLNNPIGKRVDMSDLRQKLRHRLEEKRNNPEIKRISLSKDVLKGQRGRVSDTLIKDRLSSEEQKEVAFFDDARDKI